MKKLILGLTLLSSLTSFANDTITGVVMEVQCNSVTGLGYVDIQTVENNTRISNWYKVDSRELCSTNVEADYFLFETAVLSEIASRNITNRTIVENTFTLNHDNEIVAIENETEEDGRSYFSGARLHERNNLEENQVINWYFSNRRSY